jgi:hypothetical protein
MKPLAKGSISKETLAARNALQVRLFHAREDLRFSRTEAQRDVARAVVTKLSEAIEALDNGVAR